MTDPVGIIGRAGTARPVPVDGTAPATLVAWVLTIPGAHPLWSQYILCVITLADLPGVPPATRSDPDHTHELMVMTLDPDHGPYGPGGGWEFRLLPPGNVAEQWPGTDDDQARRVGEVCARAVCDGLLMPETAGAGDTVRAAWRAFIRGHLNLDRAGRGDTD